MLLIQDAGASPSSSIFVHILLRVYCMDIVWICVPMCASTYIGLVLVKLVLNVNPTDGLFNLFTFSDSEDE